MKKMDKKYLHCLNDIYISTYSNKDKNLLIDLLNLLEGFLNLDNISIHTELENLIFNSGIFCDYDIPKIQETYMGNVNYMTIGNDNILYLNISTITYPCFKIFLRILKYRMPTDFYKFKIDTDIYNYKDNYSITTIPEHGHKIDLYFPNKSPYNSHSNIIGVYKNLDYKEAISILCEYCCLHFNISKVYDATDYLDYRYSNNVIGDAIKYGNIFASRPKQYIKYINNYYDKENSLI